MTPDELAEIRGILGELRDSHHELSGKVSTVIDFQQGQLDKHDRLLFGDGDDKTIKPGLATRIDRLERLVLYVRVGLGLGVGGLVYAVTYLWELIGAHRRVGD